MLIDRILAFFGLATIFEANRRYYTGILDEQERQCREHDRRRKEREDSELYTLQCLLNKPVIGISNEWENPLVGTVVDIDFITQARCPVPIVRDALTGEDHIALCKIMPFTIQRFQAVMKLTPYERWCLIDSQNEVEYRDNDTRKLPKLYSYEEYIMALKNKDFLAILNRVDV